MKMEDLLEIATSYPKYKLCVLATLGPDEIMSPCEFKFEGHRICGVDHANKVVNVIVVECDP